MQHLFFSVFVVVTAYAFAKVEIQIEGPNGWAANLPTWRISNRWTKLFYSSRPLTGYHAWFQMFIVLMIHFPFALAPGAWSWPMEARVIAYLIFFFILEDFLWFVLNPAYGLRRFRAEHIEWHAPHWWWIMPRDYWVFAVIGAGLYVWSLR